MASNSVAAPVEEPVVTVAEVEVEAVEEPVLTVAEVEVEAAPVEVGPMGSPEAEPVLTVEEVVVTVPKPAIGAIGKMVEELLADASLGYLAIVEQVVAAFPTAKTTQRSIASVAADMRRRGLEVPMRNGKRMA